MRPIVTTAAPAPKGHYAQAVTEQGLVFVTAQNGTDPATGDLVEGLEAQTEQALANVEAILDAAGGSLDDALRVGLYLIDMADLATVNAVYAERFGAARPARSTMQVAGLPAGARVAFDAVARAGTAS